MIPEVCRPRNFFFSSNFCLQGHKKGKKKKKVVKCMRSKRSGSQKDVLYVWYMRVVGWVLVYPRLRGLR